MKKNVAILITAVIVYILLIQSFVASQVTKPFAVRLADIPHPEAVRFAAADQRYSVAAFLVFKVLVYFGEIVEKAQNKIEIPADYPAMSRLIHTVVELDPYNMDAYYFGQAILVWDVKQIKLANELLEYGMKYRTWDFYLPFFVGFNNAYFLKDYEKAAQYYKRAGELTGDELHVNLAGRYMYESGRTDLAISYLNAMIRGTKNDAVRKSFQKRLAAFQEVRKIELARSVFQDKRGYAPRSVEELINAGFLVRKPIDPYGGEFYLDRAGEVRSTSNFAFKGAVR